MVKWEYHIEDFSNYDYNPEVPDTEQAVAYLNKLGADGWEVVAVEDNEVLFKRPVQTKPESFRTINGSSGKTGETLTY